MGKSKRRKRARAARARAAAIREPEKHLSDWTHDNVEMAGKVRLAEKEVTALRDAASESSLRREADCLAIRTERDRWKQAFEKLVIKYNLPVRLG